MKVYTYVDIVESVFPFLVNFVFECELDIAATHLSTVNKKQRDFVRSEGLFSDYVVDYRFAFKASLCCESIFMI